MRLCECMHYRASTETWNKLPTLSDRRRRELRDAIAVCRRHGGYLKIHWYGDNVDWTCVSS